MVSGAGQARSQLVRWTPPAASIPEAAEIAGGYHQRQRLHRASLALRPDILISAPVVSAGTLSSSKRRRVRPSGSGGTGNSLKKLGD